MVNATTCRKTKQQAGILENLGDDSTAERQWARFHLGMTRMH
jgi:hypothetical protein